MNNISTMPDASFRAVKAWFADSSAATAIEKLESIHSEKKFRNVVSFVCNGKSRYFLVDSELTANIANSLFQHIPLTPAEGAFLDCVKSQLDGRVQLILDSASDNETIAKVSQNMPGFIRFFEVTNLQGKDLKRFVVELRPHV